MADISHLDGVKSTQPLDIPIYKAGAPKPFPLAGRYTVRAPESFTKESFTQAKSSGALVARVDPTIVGGQYDGYQIRGVRVSAKPYVDRKSGKETSQMAKYVSACGQEGEFPGDAQAQADAVERTANTIYEAVVDWEIDDNASGFKLRGMENFPKDANGNPVRFVTLDGSNGRPRIIDPLTNEPQTLRAFCVVRWFNRLSN
jgi:hypothetical protein